MASFVAENESFVAAEVQIASRIRRCFRSLKDWWGETTDIVILNSPLLNRATGNAFRCITLSYLLILIVFSDNIKHTLASPVVVAATVLLLIGSLASFMAIVLRWRESVGASWFYCFVLAASQQIFTSQWYSGKIYFVEERFICILAVLRHCNIHPIPLLVVMGSMLGILIFDAHAGFFGPFLEIRRVWTGCLLLLMFCAYTQDFTVRVKAISTGMILPGLECDPGEQGAHKSPLSGRSARSICWLMMLITWVTWGSLMIGKVFYKAEAGPHYQDLFQNRLPICTWLVPCMLSASILVWVCSKSASRSPFLADLMLLICACTPPAMIFADYVPVVQALGSMPDLVQMEYAWEFQAWVRSMLFISEQVLVQAGCHPILCFCPCALLPLHTVVLLILDKPNTPHWMDHLLVEWTDIEFFVSWIILITSSIDYLNRYRAIREALQRAQQNAASTQSLLNNITITSCSGLELQHLMPPAEPPTVSDSVAVAVVRHAERADAAHALDDWGCSEVEKWRGGEVEVERWRGEVEKWRGGEAERRRGLPGKEEFPYDPPITAEGVQQVKELAYDLKQQLASLDVIISSPYLRCVQTAEILAEEFDVLVLLDAEVGHWDNSAN
eukprot:Skav217401  [mRNA]  locus=scaffold532:747331:752181:- [translate_table: standard]